MNSLKDNSWARLKYVEPVLVEMVPENPSLFKVSENFNEKGIGTKFACDLVDILKGHGSVKLQTSNSLNNTSGGYKTCFIERISLPKLSIVLKGEAADEFRRRVGQMHLSKDLDNYAIAKSILSNERYAKRTAFLIDNPKIVKDVLVDLKCEELNAMLNLYYLKEVIKFKKYIDQKTNSSDDASYTRYKECKITLLGENLRHGLFTADFNRSNITTTLDNLKVICREFLNGLRYLRVYYLDEAKKKEREDITHSCKEERINSRMSKWNFKNREMGRIL